MDLLNQVTFLTGNRDVLERISAVATMPTFDDLTVDFLNELSRALLSKAEYRTYVDLMSYGFWIRKSHLMKERVRYEGRFRMGRGVAFHIAPSNVPVNFAVSMTSALLAGNACVIRVSEKEFDQVRIITNELNGILEDEKYIEFRDRICIIRYPHDKEITDYLSSISDVRIIWGGDRTIEEVRRSPLPPRGIEMTFADRHSIAIIDASYYAGLSDEEAKQVAKDFYTDTYYSDQNACSSPRMVVWYGGASQERFWSFLIKKVKEGYELQPVVAVDKLEKFAELSTDITPIRLIDDNPICMRIEVDALSDKLMDYKMLGGYFFEYETSDLQSITPVLGKRAQTIAYLGVEPSEIAGIVSKAGVKGVDRIVPVGHTMDLSFFWDGYDMIEAMSRGVFNAD